MCVVFCVLYFLQNNPVFLSVIISHILKNENYELCFLAGFFINQIMIRKNCNHKKKVQLSGHWLEQISDNHLLCQNMNTNYQHGKNYDPEKKRYSRLDIGCNKSQITVCHVKIRTPTMTRKNYDQKKKYSHLQHT